jgi:hypothetical protein
MLKSQLPLNGKEAYWNLFVNRRDVYLKQNAQGIPHKVNSPLTYDILFDKKDNIGTYQLNRDSKVTYAVLDIDLVKSVHSRSTFKVDDWLPMLQKQTRNAKALLSKEEIDSYVEFSGFKGYHIWIFYDASVDAAKVRRWMRDVFDDMPRVDDRIAWEIFPKQDKINGDGLGSYVKPPLQIHKKSGKFSYFVDDDFNKLEVDLSKVKKNAFKPHAASKEISCKLDADKIDVIIDKCRWMQKTIEAAKADRLSDDTGHERRLALASILHPFGENGYHRLTEILTKCSDFDPDTTRRQWESIDKPPHTCARLCNDKLCREIKAAGGRSPIKFAYDSNGKTEIFTEQHGCYYKKQKKISTFVIQPRELLVLEESDCLIADVKSSSGYCYKDVKLENVDWHTRQKFLRAIGHQDCTFTGSENDLQELCSYVNGMTPVRKQGTKVIGLMNDTWVIKDLNVTRDGTMSPMKIVPFERGADAYYHKIHYQSIDDREKRDFIADFYSNFTRVNEAVSIYPIIGWFFASVLKSVIETKLDGFPLLFIHGSQGSGKSTTGSMLMRIAGYQDPSPNSCAMRPFPLLKLLSSNNGIPIILDEFKMSDMRRENVDTLFRYMRSSYKGEVEQKGRADQTVDEYRLSAPIAIMGEWNISQPALRERFILVRLRDIIKKSAVMQKAYDDMKNLPLEGFMPGFIEFCLNQDIDELINTASNIVRCKVAPRIRNNLIVMTVGLILFQRYGKSCGIDIDEITYDKIIKSQVNNITGNDTGFVKSAVDQLLEELEVLAMNGEISSHSEYKVIEDGKYLAIAFNYIYPKFRTYAERTQWDGDILDRQSYKELFRECDYVITESKVTRYETDRSKRSVIIDIDKAKQRGIQLDGFFS